MRRLISLTLAASAAAAPSFAQGSVHEQCLKAADYKGCVEVMSGGGSSPSGSSAVNSLKSSMRLLPGRLENTSLRDFNSNTQIFRDSLASIEPSSLKSEYDKELFREAGAIARMVDALQQYWGTRIRRGTYYGTGGYRSYYCSILKPALGYFNAVAGSYTVAYNGYVTGGGFLNPKTEKCSPQESGMVSAIRRRVDDALIDPEVKKAQLEKARREAELARMGPWLRHLEENPNLKKWAEANPAAAEKAKEKFLNNLSSKDRKTGNPVEEDNSPSERNDPAYPFGNFSGCNKYGVCR